MTDETETQIPGERAQGPSAKRVDNNLLLKRGAVALAVVAFIGFALWSMQGPQPKADAGRSEHRVIRQMSDFEPAEEKAPVPPRLPNVELPTPVVTPRDRPKEDALLDSARRAPVMAFDGQNGGTRKSSFAQKADRPSDYLPLGGAGGFNGSEENAVERFDRMMRPTRLEGSRAGQLGNRNFIVAMGTSIPCVLETALSSDQPGFASCVISRDVLSDNGRVVLMEKGTQVVGEYRGGLKRGQHRLFVLWNRAKTPTGVIITLASPATDALGRAGIDGYVDTHWWERFGSALLLSIVDDAATSTGSFLHDQDVRAEGTTTAGKEAAAIAVEQSINIPPTLEKNQGERVSIFVARDLDFSGVYSLRVTEPRSKIYDRAALGDFRPAPSFITK